MAWVLDRWLFAFKVQVELSHGSNISGEGDAHQSLWTFCTNDGPSMAVSEGRSCDEGRPLCFTVKMDVLSRNVRVARSELTKKRVVGVERIGERGRRNRIDGYPFRSFFSFSAET